MTTDKLIKSMREYAEADEMPFRLVREALIEAADRLEELDERVSIMAADMDRDWGKNY